MGCFLDKPSPRPTWRPTPKPTLSPTMDYCKTIKENSGVQLVVSNECVFATDDECKAMRGFLRDVVELTFSPQVSQYLVRNHFGAQYGGDFSQRESLLSQLNSFPCHPGGDNDNVNYYHALDNALNSVLGASHFTGTKQIVMISFCKDPQETSSENGQITCDLPKQKDESQMKQIEIGAVNIGPADNYDTNYFDIKNQFSCLVSSYYPQDLVNIYRGDEMTLTRYYPYLKQVEDVICKSRHIHQQNNQHGIQHQSQYHQHQNQHLNQHGIQHLIQQNVQLGIQHQNQHYHQHLKHVIQ